MVAYFISLVKRHRVRLSTHDVAQKRPNAFNLYDMLGNEWEWVNDWYGENATHDRKSSAGPALRPCGFSTATWF